MNNNIYTLPQKDISTLESKIRDQKLCSNTHSTSHIIPPPDLVKQFKIIQDSFYLKHNQMFNKNSSQVRKKEAGKKDKAPPGIHKSLEAEQRVASTSDCPRKNQKKLMHLLNNKKIPASKLSRQLVQQKSKFIHKNSNQYASLTQNTSEQSNNMSFKQIHSLY